MNITSIIMAIGGTGTKAIGLIPNSSVTEEAVTMSIPTPIMNWIIFFLILFIIWKIFFRR